MQYHSFMFFIPQLKSNYDKFSHIGIVAKHYIFHTSIYIYNDCLIVLNFSKYDVKNSPSMLHIQPHGITLKQVVIIV